MEALITRIKIILKHTNVRIIINSNISLAYKYQLDGVYIPAFNKQINFINGSLPINFKIIGSAHNNIEILIKQKQGCVVIFLSPIFKVKKRNYFLDIVKFNLLTLNKKVKFVALGGINKHNKNKLNLLKICGFAGISFFQKKTAP